MLKSITRRSILFFLLLLIIAIGVFFGRFEAVARRAASDVGLTVQQSDSIKHAYAAAQLYTLFTRAGIPPVTAEESVLFLGRVTEHAEHIVKFWRKDHTRGVIKDLSNNQMGIEAVKRMGEAAARITSADRLCLISALAKNGTLIRSPDEVPLTKNEKALETSVSDVESAIAWFDFHRPQIIERLDHPRNPHTQFACGQKNI